MKKCLLAILLVGIVFTSGCTGAADINNTRDLQSVAENPETYLNENIKVRGTLTTYIHFQISSIEWKYYLVDGQRYKFPVELPSENRDFYVGENYEISGKVEKLEYCFCQKRYVDLGEDDFVENGQKLSFQYAQNWDCPLLWYEITGGWKDVSYSPEKQLSSSCLSNEIKEFNCSFEYITDSATWKFTKIDFSFKEEYRCNPDTIETLYYIKPDTITKI